MKTLKNQKILVVGLGVSGNSALTLLKLLNLNVQGRNTNDTDFTQVLLESTLVILSPGIPREDIFTINPKIEIWGEIELAYRYLDSVSQLKPLIGITGTNGKTTTTTFLGEMIQTAGKKVFVGGNIGIPCCDMAIDVLKNNTQYDYILLELSSFQLESIDHFHVNIAVILNIFQNHGERYSTIEDYAHSKFFITKNMTSSDLLIYPQNFKLLQNWGEKQITRKIAIDIDNLNIRFDVSKFKLPGVHNLVNLAFVINIALELKLENSAIQASINHFCGVHHRIEFVDSYNKFISYNDAKSTNWDATLTAVSAMVKKGKRLYLIIGGKKRGHGDSILPILSELLKTVDRFYLIGEMALEIENELKHTADYKNLTNLESVMADIKTEKFEGILLFSPGFPSFDQYANYEKRGEHFISLVKA